MNEISRSTTISRAMLWFGACYVAALVAYFALNAVAGRWLGTNDFGDFVTALVLCSLLGQVGLIGVHRSGLREAARLRDGTDPQRMAALRDGVRAVMLTTLPAVAVAAGVAGYLYAAGHETGTRTAMALGVAALVYLSGQQKVWASFLRGLGHIRFASLIEGRSGGALVAALQTAAVMAVWHWRPSWGLPGALAAAAVGYALPGILASRMVRAHWRGLRRPSQLLSTLRMTAGRDWRFLSSQAAVHLNLSVEIFIAALLLSDVQTSLFSAGQRLAQPILIPLTAIQVVLAPVIARMAFATDQHDTLQALVRTGATVATALTAVIALPLVVAPETVLELVYGNGFEAAAATLLLLSIGYVGNVATGLAGTTLSMLHREGVTARTQWTGVLLRVCFGVPAAYFGGLLGLSLSAAGVTVVVFTLMWLRTRHAVGVYTHATLRPELRLLRARG